MFPGDSGRAVIVSRLLLSFYTYTYIYSYAYMYTYASRGDKSGGRDHRQQGDVRKTNDPEGAAHRIIETIAEQH